MEFYWQPRAHWEASKRMVTMKKIHPTINPTMKSLMITFPILQRVSSHINTTTSCELFMRIWSYTHSSDMLLMQWMYTHQLFSHHCRKTGSLGSQGWHDTELPSYMYIWLKFLWCTMAGKDWLGNPQCTRMHASPISSLCLAITDASWHARVCWCLIEGCTTILQNGDMQNCSKFSQTDANSHSYVFEIPEELFNLSHICMQCGWATFLCWNTTSRFPWTLQNLVWMFRLTFCWWWCTISSEIMILRNSISSPKSGIQCQMSQWVVSTSTLRGCRCHNHVGYPKHC